MMMLEIESKASHMLGEIVTTDLYALTFQLLLFKWWKKYNSLHFQRDLVCLRKRNL